MARILEEEATLVVDGIEHSVYVRATIRGDGREAKEWFGFLGTEDGGVAWAFFNARQASLRLADGREGQVVATGVDDPDVGIGFQGSGRPPA
jgi:hypothetical protein